MIEVSEDDLTSRFTDFDDMWCDDIDDFINGTTIYKKVN